MPQPLCLHFVPGGTGASKSSSTSGIGAGGAVAVAIAGAGADAVGGTAEVLEYVSLPLLDSVSFASEVVLEGTFGASSFTGSAL